jgi:hypothetical protein
MTIPPSDLQIVTVRRLQKRHLPAQWLQLPVEGTSKADDQRPKRQAPLFCKDHTPWMK